MLFPTFSDQSYHQVSSVFDMIAFQVMFTGEDENEDEDDDFVKIVNSMTDQ